MERKTRSIIFDPEKANDVLLGEPQGKPEISSFIPKRSSSKNDIFYENPEVSSFMPKRSSSNDESC